MSCNFFRLVCFIALLLLTGNVFAQKNNGSTGDSTFVIEDSAYTANDTAADNTYDDSGDTVVAQTAFEDENDSILKWKSGKEFGYMAYLDSLLKRKKGLTKDTLNIEAGNVAKKKSAAVSQSSATSNSFLNGFPVQVFFWVIAIFFIGFILYKLLFKGDLFARRPAKIDEEPAGEEPERLNEYSQYTTLIREAESKDDFSLSARYLYLQTLKKLSDNGLIIFSPDKTNNLYVQELSVRNYKDEFSYLTSNYEYLWYGKFIINKEQYQQLKEQFILFNKKV